jgi:hypothetical protein
VLLNQSFWFFQQDFSLNRLILLSNQFIFLLVAAKARDVPPKLDDWCVLCTINPVAWRAMTPALPDSLFVVHCTPQLI